MTMWGVILYPFPNNISFEIHQWFLKNSHGSAKYKRVAERILKDNSERESHGDIRTSREH